MEQPIPKMKVYKFDGASFASAKRIAQIARLLDDELQTKMVVVSTPPAAEQTLARICESCYAENAAQARQSAEELRQEYHRTVDALYRQEQTRQRAHAWIDEKFESMARYLTDYFVVQDEKAVLSFGPSIQSELFHYYLNENGTDSVLIPALSFMRIDRLGEPDMYYIGQNLLPKLRSNPQASVFITQGGICLNAWGETDTLPHAGSDYTATIIGAAIPAQEVQIWAEAEPLFENDPRLVENPAPVETLSYAEAEELAYFGAKILHPLCILPAHNAGVPLRLKYAGKPKANGTSIHSHHGRGGAKAVAAKDGAIAIKIQSGRMTSAYGFLRRIFEIFERYCTPIDMITTSEVAVSLTIDDDSYLSRIVSELREFGIVSVDKDQTIVSVVGHDIVEDPRSMELFAALKGKPVRMISYGGSRNNISFVIDTAEKEDVLNKLNRCLF